MVIICLYFNNEGSILIFLKCKTMIIMFTWNCLSNFLRKKEVFESELLNVLKIFLPYSTLFYSHVHITVRSHTRLSAGSRLHSISQSPWLTAMSRSSSPSNPCLSLSDLCTSSLRLSKPTQQTCSSASRKENLEIRSTES